MTVNEQELLKTLTKAELRAWEKINDYFDKGHVLNPRHKDIARLLRRDRSTATYLIHQLEDKGLAKYDKKRKRGLTLIVRRKKETAA